MIYYLRYGAIIWIRFDWGGSQRQGRLRYWNRSGLTMTHRLMVYSYIELLRNRCLFSVLGTENVDCVGAITRPTANKGFEGLLRHQVNVVILFKIIRPWLLTDRVTALKMSFVTSRMHAWEGHSHHRSSCRW